MSAGDGVLTRTLVVLVPLEGDLERVQTDETCTLVILVEVMRRTFVPAGMETVWTLAPERPFTLQVMSFDVTSVTGLLFGGTRRNLFWPWSTPLTQMYCIVTVQVLVSDTVALHVHVESTHSGRWRQWRPQPGRRGARASWC